MMTVLKNLSNLFTILGDYAFFGRTYGLGVWACLGLMALSALCGAYAVNTLSSGSMHLVIMQHHRTSHPPHHPQAQSLIWSLWQWAMYGK